MIAQSWAVCDACAGEGSKVRDKDVCRKCKGGKTVKDRQKLELRIERGMVDGQTIVFKGQNDEEPGVPQAGDIIFRLKLQENEAFQVKGLDLMTTITLPLREALLGFEEPQTVLVHLDGRHVQLSKPGGKVTRPGSVDRLVGQGMPRERDLGPRGDLYIKWAIAFPADGWLEGRGEAHRALSSVLPPPRNFAAVDGDGEGEEEGEGKEDVSDAVEDAGKGEEFGRNQPTQRRDQGQEDGAGFWEDETEGPRMGCPAQ